MGETLILNKKFKSIEREAKKQMKDSGAHDWDHIQRVLQLAKKIGKNKDINLEVLRLSIILHDVARLEESKTMGKICHAKLGAKMARNILKQHNYDENIIRKVEHCILSHRITTDILPETIEAKILFDADTLDSLGAIGIGRAFAFAGEHGAKVHNNNIDIEKTKSYTKEDTAYREYLNYSKNIANKLYTKKGKRIAKKRIKFMKNFFKKLNNECLKNY